MLKQLKVNHQNQNPQEEEEEVTIEAVETPEELVQPARDREASPGDVVEDFHERLFDFIPESDNGYDSTPGSECFIPTSVTTN